MENQKIGVEEVFEKGRYRGWYILFGEKMNEVFDHCVGPISKGTAKRLSVECSKLITRFDFLPVSGRRVLRKLENLGAQNEDELTKVYKPPEYYSSCKWDRKPIFFDFNHGDFYTREEIS